MRKYTFPLLFILSILLIILLQQSPNYYAYYKTPPDFFYTGQASWFDPWDINVYVGAIKNGQAGHILLRNLYTTEPHNAAFIYPVYTIVGFLFRSINPYFLFHFFAISTGILLFFGLFHLSRFFIKDKWYAFGATLLTSIGGGIGWLSLPLANSGDLSLPGFAFHSTYQRPHEALGILLYFSALIFFFNYTQNQVKRNIYFSLFCMVILVLFRPYFLLSFVLVCGSFIYLVKVGKNKWFLYKKLGIIAAIITIITIFYYLHLLSSGFASVVNQSLTSPSILSIVLGYGLFFPVFIYQLFLTKNNRNDRLFLILWVLISQSLSFLPLAIARFYFLGLFFPLSILLIMTIIEFKIQGTKLIGILLVTCFLTGSYSLYIWHLRITAIKSKNVWIYQSMELKKVFNMIENSPNNGVLADYAVANMLPPHTGKSVYFGHNIQTPGAQEKLEKIAVFYQGKVATEEARRFLKMNNIHYVVYGAEEKKLGNLRYPFLIPLYKSTEVTLYEAK